MTSDYRTLPQSIDSENYLIGSMLIDFQKIGQLASTIKSDYFYLDRNSEIFKVIIELYTKNLGIDLISVSELLNQKNKLEYCGNSSTLASLMNGVSIVSLEQFETHLNFVKEKYRLREIIEKSLVSVENSYNGEGTSLEIISEFLEKTIQITRNDSEKTDIFDNLKEFTDRQEQYAINAHEGRKTIGLPTGFRNLDRLIDGYQPEHLITIAAGSSVGKTSMAINMAYHVLKQDKKVVIFSIEMSKTDMISKLLAIYLDMNPRDILKGYGDDNMYARQQPGKAWLSRQKLTMYSDLDDIEEIALAMRTEENKEHVDLFILDYIQNVSSNKYKDEYSLLTNGVKLLQKVNRGLKTTLVLLSQISIDTRKSTVTQTAEGKGSGAIRNASNVFIYMKRDVKDEEEVNNIIQEGQEMPLVCIVNKNRHGSIGAFKINMKHESGLIYEPY